MYKLINKNKLIAIVILSFFNMLVACGGGSESSQSTSSPVNSVVSGTVVISGVAIVGQTLTATHTLSDANGLGTLAFQWHKTNNENTQDIDGETNDSYTILSIDEGYFLSVTVSYVDGDGFSETITSSQTQSVINSTEVNVKPNILLIIADDQGVDASAQYTYSTDLPHTPTIDELAAQGIVFDNAWATPACTTTRGTIITGMHGVNSGVSFVPAELDSSSFTLQRYIKSLPEASDYQTAVIGKWHLGGGNPDLSHPTDSGVDYYAGNIAGVIPDYEDWELTINGSVEQSTEYHTSKVTDLAIDWMSTQEQQSSPWFLWLAYVAPHFPFHLPPSDLHTRDSLTGTSEHIDANRREYYLAAIEAMDTEIGRLLDSMSSAERDNTIVIYIGDNGTPTPVIDREVFIGSHGKGSLYEGGIRVPMIVSGKGVERINERESALVNTSDFFATFGQLLGGSDFAVNDSYSFSDLLIGNGSGLRSYNYSEFESNDVTGWTVRNNDYKLIEFADATQELYYLTEDLAEENQLIGAEGDYQAIIDELSAYASLVRGELNN
ncbi:MAG: sulfatase-like hydrolase/transferase [Kangiellaceae bacterium]